MGLSLPPVWGNGPKPSTMRRTFSLSLSMNFWRNTGLFCSSTGGLALAFVLVASPAGVCNETHVLGSRAPCGQEKGSPPRLGRGGQQRGRQVRRGAITKKLIMQWAQVSDPWSEIRTFF